MLGNWATGISCIATRPAMVMTSEMTTASRGLSMKIEENIRQASGLTSVASTTWPGFTF